MKERRLKFGDVVNIKQCGFVFLPGAPPHVGWGVCMFDKGHKGEHGTIMCKVCKSAAWPDSPHNHEPNEHSHPG